MSDLPCACGLTMADNCRCEAGDIAYTSDLQDELTKLRSDLSDATTECAFWLDRASRHRAEIERLQAELREAREVIDSIYVFANDTLSGRADGGPDDRAWQREAVVECRNRARAFLAKVQP